jgi:putative spermidine/putrescine transport system permease protein
VRGKWSYLLFLPALLFIIFFLVVPILLTMVSTVQVNDGWTLSGYTNFFKDYYLRDIYFRTLKIAGITTILAAFLGFPTSYYISRSAKKYRGIFLVLAVFPLLTSPVVRSFSWMIILGKNGIINDILLALSLVDEPLNLLYTEFSVITGLLYLFLPLMILSLVGVMENIDGELIRAAESLGASKFKAFMKIVFPLSLPGLIIGTALVFTGSFTAYTTPMLLGGDKTRVLSTLIYENALALFNWEQASLIAAVMIITTFTIVVLINYFSDKLNPGGVK